MESVRKSFGLGVGLIFFLGLQLSCSAGSQTTGDQQVQGSVDSSQENLLEDPYFKAPPVGMEYFRVLITNGAYIVYQVKGPDKIQRRPDTQGDDEQLVLFKEFESTYNFRDWTLSGMIHLRLNPHNGDIEHIEYVPGKNPKSWQAMKYFQEDVSRFLFDFPGKNVGVQELWISYEWRIKQQPGITPDESKTRAIEFLKSQCRNCK